MMLEILVWLVAALAVGILLLALAIFRWPKATLAAISRATLRRQGARFRFVDAPRGRLGYFTMGEGPPVALLHGAGDQAGTWAKIAPRLAGRFRLILPDLPGHERSAPRSGPLSQGDMADGLEAVLAAEAPEGRVALVGNSMGGWTSLLWAERHPERVSVLVLEDSGGLSGTDVDRRFAIRKREEARELMKTTFGPQVSDSPSYVLDDLLRRVAKPPLASLVASDEIPFHLDGRLAAVGAPAHLVWGEHDGLLPLDFARRLAAELPRSRLHVIGQCGHIPHLQRPEEFLALVEKILDDPQGLLERAGEP